MTDLIGQTAAIPGFPGLRRDSGAKAAAVDCKKTPSAKRKPRSAEAGENNGLLRAIAGCSGHRRIPILYLEVAHPFQIIVLCSKITTPRKHPVTHTADKSGSDDSSARLPPPTRILLQNNCSGRVAKCAIAEVGGTLDPWQSLSAPPIGCPAVSPHAVA